MFLVLNSLVRRYSSRYNLCIYVANNYMQMQEQIKRHRRKVPGVIQQQETAMQIGECDEESDNDDYEVQHSLCI